MTAYSPNVQASTTIQWDETWPRIFDHYQQDLRHAYYINAMLDDEDQRVLEMGAGSFRDMALLNRLGVCCWGTDYSSASVALAQRQFPELAPQIFRADAFDLNGLSDKVFDMSFHNGLWVLFDDPDIQRLVKEQARVSRRRIIATVHNAHNLDFVEYFARLGEADPLYRIRFFECEEIRALMELVCSRVDIIPVGKGKKYFEDDMINRGHTSRAEMRAFFDEAGLSHLRSSERLLCIGHL